jgi:hypothetical protein
MIIYNVTINIENDVHDDWFKWMKAHHIPAVMKTNCFLEYKMCKVLVQEEQGTTYSIQYTAPDMATYERYKQEHAPALQKEVQERYPDKFVAFRTLLEVV